MSELNDLLQRLKLEHLPDAVYNLLEQSVKTSLTPERRWYAC